MKCLLLCATLLISQFGFANTLRVGVVDGAPFSTDVEGETKGIAIDIWNHIAEINSFSYQLISYKEDLEKSLSDLSSGEIDVLIGPISTTQKRLMNVDFSRPYFINQMGVIFRDQKSTVEIVIQELLGGGLGTLLLTLIGAIIAFTIIFQVIRIIESKRKKSIEKKPFSEDFWDAATMIISTEQPQGSPYLRFFVFFGLLFSVGFMSFFTSMLTTQLTIEHLQSAREKFYDVSDLKNAILMGVEGETTYVLAKTLGKQAKPASSIENALEALARGEVDAVVEDAAIAQVALKNWTGKQDLVLSSLRVANDEYTFALPKNSQIREAIDLGITGLQDSGESVLICKKYISERADYCNL